MATIDLNNLGRGVDLSKVAAAAGLKHKDEHKLWADAGLINYRWKDLDTHRYALPETKVKLLWWLGRVLALKYVWGYIADFLLAKRLADSGGEYAAPFYVCVALSIYVLYVDIKEARKIIASDDVSDTFMNPESMRWFNLMYYERFCILRIIKSRLTLRDRASLFVRDILDDWKRHCVHCAQGIILFLVYLDPDPNKMDECTVWENSDQSTPEPSECVFNEVVVWLKLVMCLLPIIALCWSVLIYPCLRCYVVSELGSFGTDFTTFCTFRIDFQLNKLLQEKDGGAPEMKITPQEAILGTTAPGTETTSPAGDASSPSPYTPAPAPAHDHQGGGSAAPLSPMSVTVDVSGQPPGGYVAPAAGAYAPYGGQPYAPAPQSPQSPYQSPPAQYQPPPHDPHAPPYGGGGGGPPQPYAGAPSPYPVPYPVPYGGAPAPAPAMYGAPALAAPKMVQCGACSAHNAVAPETPMGSTIGCHQCRNAVLVPY